MQKMRQTISFFFCVSAAFVYNINYFRSA